MIYVRQPTPDEYAELRRLTRQAVGRVSQRAQIVLWSAQHRTVPEIAAIFELHPASVRTWIGRFDVAGPAGLLDDPRSGRPRKADPQVQHTVDQLLRTDPQGAGYQATAWTVAMLLMAVGTRLGVTVSCRAMRTLLHQLGLRWRRPRLAMPHKVDPEKAQKQWRIAEAVLAAGPDAAILYADESRSGVLPLVRALWQWVGQQLRIPTPGTNKTRSLFGALNIRTGHWTYLVREHMYKEACIAFLEHLLTVYSTGASIVIVDNYSSHTAYAVRDWLAEPEHARLQVHVLPKYCSHLNPVERIWLRLKDKVAANRLHGSITHLLQTVDTFFTEMTPDQALTWAAA